MKRPAIICLGRYGDILNALPLAEFKWLLWGEKPKFVVSKQFWEILECASYVHPIVWDLDYKELPRAIRAAKNMSGTEPIVCQSYMHPDQRHLTDSYQKESWRVAGEQFQMDESSTAFTLNLDIKRWDGPVLDRKTILVAQSGVSSPLRLDGLVERLKSEGHKVVTTDEIGRLAKPYSIMSSIESCGLLITIDTMHLHLARAAPNTPVVALINNGWFGSVPPRNSVLVQRYAEIDESAISKKAAEVLCG